MKLKAGSNVASEPHPTGVFPAVCVDVIDLGMITEDHNGDQKTYHKVRIVWETSEKKPDGTPYTLGKRLTASLHPKARLTELLSKWRGRQIQAEEVIDMQKLIGASASLVVGHTTGRDGTPMATIDAVTRPTVKLQPSGKYDPAAARQKIMEKTGRGLPGYNPVSSAPEAEDQAEAVAEAAAEPVGIGF